MQISGKKSPSLAMITEELDKICSFFPKRNGPEANWGMTNSRAVSNFWPLLLRQVHKPESLALALLISKVSRRKIKRTLDPLERKI